MERQCRLAPPSRLKRRECSIARLRFGTAFSLPFTPVGGQGIGGD